MTPRERRLKSDFEKITAEFSDHPYIKVEFDTNGFIPEKYQITYTGINGIRLIPSKPGEEKIVEIIDEHVIEIYLHIDYPRMKPQCYCKTEIFHPNFRMAHPHDICIGDYWASGETLYDLIYQIGEMIQYQNYNIKNPLNGVAAKWAREHSDTLPVGNINLWLGEIKLDLGEKNNLELNL
jgi:hypothetical protein